MLRGLRRGADAADVDEAPYAGLLRRLHQVMRAVEVHRFEGPAAARVLDRRVRKLDGADQGVEAAEGGAEGGGLAHVGGARLDAITEALPDPLRVAAEDGDLLSLAPKLAHDGRANEPSATGNQNHRIPLQNE